MTASSAGLAMAADLGLARRPHRGERDDIDLGADRLDAGDGPRGEVPQDRLEPVVARMVQMIGLGRGEKDLVDLRPEQGRQEVAAARAKRRQHVGHGDFEVAHGGGSRVQRGERVDEDDLAVEPGEMIPEERFDDMRLIGLVAPLHHGGEGIRRIDFTFLDGERREGQGGRAFEVARHQEAARRQAGEMIFAGPAGAQIVGEKLGRPARVVLIGLGRADRHWRRSPRHCAASGARAALAEAMKVSRDHCAKDLSSSGRSSSHSPG